MLALVILVDLGFGDAGGHPGLHRVTQRGKYEGKGCEQGEDPISSNTEPKPLPPRLSDIVWVQEVTL